MLISFLPFYFFTFLPLKARRLFLPFYFFYPFTFKSPLKVFSDAILLTFWTTSKKV
nr:MAG TPA: hypothetical protein [Caudoviricetes sp.]